MKRAILFALLFLATPAIAQQALDTTPGALTPDQFVILKDTRWMPQLRLTSVSSAASHYLPVAMDGTIREAWMSLEAQVGGTAANTVYVSISRRNSSVIQPVGTIILPTGAIGVTNNYNIQFGGEATVKEGDAIIVATTSRTGGAAAVANIVLRIAN